MANVLQNITDGAAVYTDREYGMNSGKAMTIWLAAYFEAQVSPVDGAWSPIQQIQDHFDAKNVSISSAQIRAIVADGQVLDTQVTTLEGMLVESKIFTTLTDITPLTLAAEQWASGALLNSNATSLPNATYYESMTNLGMNFVSVPEGAFNYDCNPGLNRDQVMGLFN